MRNIMIDRTFPATYEVSAACGDVIYFPFKTLSNTRDIVLTVRSATNEWCGVFEAGKLNTFGVFSCPNPDDICVLSGGTVFISNVERASNHGPIQYEDVESITPSLENNMLILARANLEIIACSTRECWRSDRLCVDEVRIEKVEAGFIHASCWDPHLTERVPFRIDAKTGEQLDYRMP